MKAIVTEKYIIPVTSINFIERYHGRAIEVYLKHPIAGTVRLMLEYSDPSICDKAYAEMTATLTGE